ncbi:MULTISPECIES: AAA family ATPase [Paraburkholderia]|jgi:pilus assembly protein CpaE|uniref:AAA domain-containing protein n=2 Tax=Paraburkholderia TaxID=1822464 RepID=A0ABN7KSN9_9BURK|nr:MULTISPECIES: AAA family ATPase [Paraburkholderia]MBK3742802.1 AAA family ATPase [Paraburkholderia aspalathi]MBK3810688.1 AAA family ATPase [Paraburkholderia aspalathi]MBK3817644.1 AAA family ATPase [Paraburkholderia aspalathi]MBK3829459.1 AAA family ATPase [Paraburkholderia aspalathi]MBK3859144.1 AAA family ATPase [Paraburkholderia aspalathi]
MIDILLISSSAERSTHIGAQLEQSGVAYRLRTLHGEARQLRAYAAAIKTADLLIVDDVDLSARELSGFEEVLAQAHLHCMLVTPAPSTSLLMAAMRVGVRHVLSWPLDDREIADALTHVANKKNAGLRREGRVVSVSSCKGGTGTTLIAVNLAYTLAAQRDKRVLLIDLNQQFADASLLVADKAPPATLADLCSQIDRLDAAFFEACVMHVHANLDVLAGAGDPVKAAELRPAHLERMLTLVREQYDAVIVDVGQSINPLTIHVLDHSDTICMVVRQNILYLHSGRRMLDIFKELGYPASKVRVVVNQYDKNAQISLPTLEETLGAKVAHKLPRDEKHANDALNHGIPVVTAAKGSALAQGIVLLAEMLWPVVAAPRKGVLSRLFATRANPLQQLKTEH